jgi:hypothetical protein
VATSHDKKSARFWENPGYHSRINLPLECGCESEVAVVLADQHSVAHFHGKLKTNEILH